jgi:hypothetical protein
MTNVMTIYTHVPQDLLTQMKTLSTNYLTMIYVNYICNHHACNLACYKSNIDASKKLCRYGFPQPLINTTHFDNDIGLLHIKRNDKWLNNANPWILSTSKCNHDLKFIATLDKDNKSLINTS